MNKPADPARTDSDASKVGSVPPSETKKKDVPVPPPPRDVDKEGGAPVDELDLDGDGARKE